MNLKVLVLLLLLPLISLIPPGGTKPFVVVIDAGHGGKDPGAVGSKSFEKDVALAVALRLGKLIKDSAAGVEVLFTREKDEFIELHKRAQIANDARADMFISIHCNASTQKAARGAETYVMGMHANERNMRVAKRENQVIDEEEHNNVYKDFDLESAETRILLENYQNAYLLNSANLADKIQEEFINRGNRYDRGIHQAGFIVLWKTNLPSVLVELGFISNVEEEKYLTGIKGQKEAAYSIFKALKTYMLEVKGE